MVAALVGPPRASRSGRSDAPFRPQGLSGNAVEDVAAEAGVSKGRIRFHFGSKDGLAVAVSRELQLAEARWIHEVAGHEEDPLGAIEELLKRNEMHRIGRLSWRR